MNLDVENLMKQRRIGIIHGILIIMSFGLPWAYPEDYTNTASIFGMTLTSGRELARFADIMGFIMTVAMMVIAALYLWKRWRHSEAVKTSITLFTIVVIYPIIAGGSIEKIWLGYLVTLLLCAPIPTLIFVNWSHNKLVPHGGFQAVSKRIYGNISGRVSEWFNRTRSAKQP